MAARSVAEKLLIKPDTTLWSSDDSRLELVGRSRPVSAESTPQSMRPLPWSSPTTPPRYATSSPPTRSGWPDWTSSGSLPKGNRTDINRDSLWPFLSELGLRPVTQVSIDQMWSALRFRPLKQGEAPFTGGRS